MTLVLFGSGGANGKVICGSVLSLHPPFVLKYDKALTAMAAVEHSPPIVPERRRPSPDIIDVDLLGEDTIHAAARPSQRRRVDPRSDVIEILDSDDESQAGPSQPRASRCSPSLIYQFIRFY